MSGVTQLMYFEVAGGTGEVRITAQLEDQEQSITAVVEAGKLYKLSILLGVGLGRVDRPNILTIDSPALASPQAIRYEEADPLAGSLVLSLQSMNLEEWEPTPTPTPGPLSLTLLATWGPTGIVDRPAGSGDGEFDGPSGIAVDREGNVYVADSGNDRVQVFSSSGEFLRSWGSYGSGDGQFRYPHAIAVDGMGNVYVADTIPRVQVFSPTGEFLRAWAARYPQGIAVDGPGNVYVTELGGIVDPDYRVTVFSSSGEFLRRWGSPGSGDGEFHKPNGIAVDREGNVYVADSGNDRVQVFSSSGEFLRAWGSAGSGDAQFRDPRGIAVDGEGNVYVTEVYDDRVKVFSPTGELLHTWGSVSNNPSGIAVDGTARVYVTETSNNRVLVLSIEWRSR